MINCCAHKPVSIYKASKKTGKRKQYEILHEIADGMRPAVGRQFLKAVESAKNGISKKKLIAALENRDIDKFISLFDDTPFKTELNKMASSLQRVFEASAIAASDFLPNQVQSSISFDLLNPQSVAFLRQYQFDLVTGIDTKTKDALRQALITSFEDGVPPVKLAQHLKTFIGLTSRQQAAVANFRQTLEDEGRKTTQIEKMTERFYQRQLRRRATNIARTETIRASNKGQKALWQQAIQQGLIDQNTSKKIWVITPDDRLCPLCEGVPDLNPDGVSIEGLFDSDVGPVDGPPLHPQCRCAVALETK